VLEREVNSTDRSVQARALAPDLAMVPGGAITQPGLTGVKFNASTFRSQGHLGLVQAGDAQGRVYTAGLYQDKSGWLIYGTRLGGMAKTTVATTATRSVFQATTLARLQSSYSTNCLPGVGTRLPVILVHGFLGSPTEAWGTLSDPHSMLTVLSKIPGIDVTTFDYSSVNTSWVDNPAIGPALAGTIKCDAAASAEAGGPGRVVIVAHSMGGDAVRWAATNGGAGRYIGYEVTIGTPNLGSAWANVVDPMFQAACRSTAPISLYGPNVSACPDISALQGLSERSPQIQSLPWLPPNIGVTAIGGDLSIGTVVFGVHAIDNTHSDIVVGQKSALQTRDSSSGSDLVVSCTATPTHLDASCSHKSLPHSLQVEQDTANAIRAYLASLPAPANQFSYPGYWLQDGGVWRVHGVLLTFKPGGSGLSASISWSAANQSDLTVTQVGDGSIGLKFQSGNPAYPPDPQVGQTFVLQPVGPYYAKAVFDSNSPADMANGNPNYCQTAATAAQHTACSA
jgi:pimeloyl-ACP methyl ester carboxylesterase